MIPNLQTKLTLLFLGLVMILLAGCASGSEGPAFTPTVEITSSQRIGQTFLSEWDGLHGIEVYITPSGPLPDALRVSLYEERTDLLPVWAGDIPIPAGLTTAWFRIPIANQIESASETYYITFETKTDQKLELSTGPGPFYINGALYRDGRPLDRQLDFRLVYQPFYLVLGVLKETLPALAVLLGFAFLFTLPGWAFLSFLWGSWERHPNLNKLILASGAGIALYPILLIPPWLVGLHLGKVIAWLLPLTAAASFGWRYVRSSWRPGLNFRRPDLFSVLLAGALLAVLVSRLLPLRLLEAGMGGDSYHHTLITQLIFERGGLFSSWEPYAPLLTFTYHYGFHAAAAVMSWVLGLSTAQSVLWTGQILNFLAVAGLVPLVSVLISPDSGAPISSRRAALAGLVGVVTAGLLSPMPMYYVNWGRYTQLAGQALLLVWIVLALDLFRARRRKWIEDIPAWVLLAGLGLTHYRVLIFAVLWIAANGILQARAAGFKDALAKIWRIGYGAALLFLPWFWNVFGGELMTILGVQLTTPPAGITEVVENYNRIGELTQFLPLAVWGLLTLIVIWGFQRRDRNIYLVTFWSLLLFIIANPAWIGLPGSGAINNFAVLIAAYIPAAMILAIGSGWLWDLFQGRTWLSMPAIRYSAGFAVFVGLVWGAVYQYSLVNERVQALVTRPDVAAYTWVQVNIPEEAVFLVDMIEAGGGSTLTGTDGGWWLPYFTGRETVLPPFIFISEKTKPPDLRLQLMNLNTEMDTLGFENPIVLDALAARGVTHVFLGQQHGGSNGKAERLTVGALLDNEHFELLYHIDRVWVFSFKR